MSAKAKTATVKAELRRNRLILRFSGAIGQKDLDSLYTDVRFCVADLKPGFQVINDLSECTFSSLGCLRTFRNIMHFLLEKEVGQIVRVTRKSSLIHKQISNFSAWFQGYKPMYASTFAEAEKLLDEPGVSRELNFFLHQTPAHFLAGGARETGYIREISTEGCIIEFFTSVLRPDEELLIEFAFPRGDGSVQPFEIRSRVSALDTNQFTATFVDPGPEQRDLLRACLVHEVHKDLDEESPQR